MISTLKPTSLVAPVTFAQNLRDVARNALAGKIDCAVGITGLSKTLVKTETIDAILRAGPGRYGAAGEDAAAPRTSAYVDLYEIQREAPTDGMYPEEALALDRRDRSDPSFSDASPESFEGAPAFETPVPIRNIVGQESISGLRSDPRLEAMARETAAASLTAMQQEQGVAVVMSSHVSRLGRAGQKRCVRCGRIKRRPLCDCPTR